MNSITITVDDSSEYEFKYWIKLIKASPKLIIQTVSKYPLKVKILPNGVFKVAAKRDEKNNSHYFALVEHSLSRHIKDYYQKKEAGLIKVELR